MRCSVFYKIKDLATVQMGYSFRSRLDSTGDGNVSVIQMKDLSQDNIVDCSALIKIDMDSVKEHHLSRVGDLIFRSRGQDTSSAILLEEPGPAVITAPLLRIRVMNPEKIQPLYLNWYIGQRDAQVFFASRAKGTVQKMISKEAIEDLEVAVPSLDIQQKIVELAALSAREQVILHEIKEKRKNYISTILTSYAKGE
jgi:restriction endonuclease S subunit